MAIAIPLGPRARIVVRYAAIVVATLVTFVFALQLSLPLERAKGKIIEALTPSYDVTIGDIEHGILPGRVYLDAVTLRTRPTKADEPITTFYIERIRVDIGLLALLGGDLSIGIDAKISTGHITGNVSLPGFGKRGIELAFEGRDLPAASLPFRAIAGLPVSGKLDFDVALDLPNEATKTHTGVNWQKAEGSFDLSCASGCVFGDGKTKLKPLLKNTSQQAMVGDGIEFGKLMIDSLDARAEIKKGSFDLTKFEMKSPDGEFHVDYSMKLEPNLDESVVTGCLRFTLSDTLHKREPATWAALQNTGAERRSDGLFHIKLADRFKSMLRLNNECGPNAKPETHALPTPHTFVRTPNLPATAPEAPKPPPIMVTPPPAPPTGGSAIGVIPAPPGPPAAGQPEVGHEPGHDTRPGQEGPRPTPEGEAAPGAGEQGSAEQGSNAAGTQPQMQ